jgi:hypothetical protein
MKTIILKPWKICGKVEVSWKFRKLDNIGSAFPHGNSGLKVMNPLPF